MRRKTMWMLVVLLLVLAAAAPALGAGTPRATATVSGKVIDALTNEPFLVTVGESYMVDAYEVSTGERQRRTASNPTGAYKLAGLAGGTYKFRVRYWDTVGLARYWWYGGTQSYDTAAAYDVKPGAVVTGMDFTIPAMDGATISGNAFDAATANAIGGPCFNVEFFEASGIGVGVLYPVAQDGSWATPGLIPAGELTGLATFSENLCGSPPIYLDKWFEGASGRDQHPDNLIADPRMFATARTFTHQHGVPFIGLYFDMIPTPTCAGRGATIIGTTLDDRIIGTRRDDVIVALDGNDVVFGRNGNDVICTAEGRDRVVAGNGDDRVFTGPGNDIAYGGGGDDVLTMEDGRDRARGNRGADILRGNAGRDVLNGGPGAPDIASGGADRDLCSAEILIGCP